MKLFQEMRQSFIKAGNLKRYLIYAVGEILLVMIGISLAFQVSNWDDNRIKQQAEIRYYQNIRDQIADDGRLIHTQLDLIIGIWRNLDMPTRFWSLMTEAEWIPWGLSLATLPNTPILIVKEIFMRIW